jgi:VanZ family protein
MGGIKKKLPGRLISTTITREFFPSRKRPPPVEKISGIFSWKKLEYMYKKEDTMRKRLLILLMIAIFYTSNTPGLRATEPATWFAFPAFKEGVSLVSVLEPGSRFFKPVPFSTEDEFLVRKTAHVTFFGLLALLFYLNLPSRKGRYLRAVLLTGVFAFTDELHQAFILNRDGRLADVLLDTAGGAAVMLLLYGWHRYRKS